MTARRVLSLTIERVYVICNARRDDLVAPERTPMWLNDSYRHEKGIHHFHDDRSHLTTPVGQVSNNYGQY